MLLKHRFMTSVLAVRLNDWLIFFIGTGDGQLLKVCRALHATSRYVTLRHATSRYVTLRYITLRHAMARYVTLRYITLCHATLRHATLRHATLRHAMSRYATSRYAMSCYATSRYITLHYATSLPLLSEMAPTLSPPLMSNLSISRSLSLSTFFLSL